MNPCSIGRYQQRKKVFGNFWLSPPWACWNLKTSHTRSTNKNCWCHFLAAADSSVELSVCSSHPIKSRAFSTRRSIISSSHQFSSVRLLSQIQFIADELRFDWKKHPIAGLMHIYDVYLLAFCWNLTNERQHTYEMVIFSKYTYMG